MNWEAGTEPYDLLSGSVERVGRGHYAVKSQSGGGLLRRLDAQHVALGMHVPRLYDFIDARGRVRVRPNKHTVRRRLCKSCGKTSAWPERQSLPPWAERHRRIAPDHSKMGGTSGRKCARVRIRPARKGGKGVEDRRNARQNQGRGELPVLHHIMTGPGSGSTIWCHLTKA